ncbi:MAG: Gfo/Idh/MocA family oxidoreductase [Clostridiales bacterium]|nr:Gfo/Idh/MocA family oxidoreductase [Clostridiales bacterium]
MKKVRIALLGCGAVSELYLPIFKHIPELELVAIADINRETTKEIAKRYSISRIYESAEQIADDKEIDAVIVATPPQYHYENIRILAESNKHILCEKPMAHTVDDCKKIIEVCKVNGVKLQLAHMKRFMRGNQKVKAIIDSGELGKIFMAECQWDVAVPQIVGTYREKAATGGGVLQDHGPHAFDLVRWWTGNDIKEISASVKIVHPERVNEDTAVVTAEHENGMTGIYHMTRIFFGREYDHDYYKIYGTKGTLEVVNEHHFPTMSLESPKIVFYGPDDYVKNMDVLHGWSLDDQVMQNSAFYSELKAFSECIIDNSEPRVSGADGLHAMECVSAAYESSISGKKIKLPLESSIDLPDLFNDIRIRDRKNIGNDYEIGSKAPDDIKVKDPVLSYRPPHIGEKWDDNENGMHDLASCDGLQRKLKLIELKDVKEINYPTDN